MQPPSHPGINQTTSNNGTRQSLLVRLKAELLARQSLPVADHWLASFVDAQRPPVPPVPALASTAAFRLLGTDITQTLASTNGTQLFPTDVSDVQTKSRALLSNIPVQVLDIEDIGSSRWSQVEAIERTERGEEVRGREVIRTVPTTDESETAAQVQSGPPQAQSTIKKPQGPHRLLVQDAAGSKAYAFELSKIEKICISQNGDAADGGLSIGAKLLLKQGTLVRRGMVMLRPEDTVVLGGKVQIWDEKWRESRKQRLLADIAAASRRSDDE